MANHVTRFTSDDGKEYVSIVVARSRPFATAVITAWWRVDGIDRQHMLGFKAFNMPADVFDGKVVSAARAELEAQAAKVSAA